MSDEQLSRAPVPDRAEAGAFFPSAYSLTKYTSSKTDFDGATYPKPYAGGKWKILMIGSQERYLMMKGGEFFSTGNHPVEMLLPMYHLDAAGFEIEVATISGDPVKFEWWAFPHEDEAVKATYKKYEKQLKQPRRLADVIGEGFTAAPPISASSSPAVTAYSTVSRSARTSTTFCAGRKPTSALRSRSATDRPACWPRRSTAANSPMKAMRCACSRTAWTPGPTSKSATFPDRWHGWWVKTYANTTSRSSTRVLPDRSIAIGCC